MEFRQDSKKSSGQIWSNNVVLASLTASSISTSVGGASVSAALMISYIVVSREVVANGAKRKEHTSDPTMKSLDSMQGKRFK
jgi:hypothetical protein